MHRYRLHRDSVLSGVSMRLLATLLSATLAAAFLLVQPPLAYAGSNGQQLSIVGAEPLTWISIGGTNQNGDYVSWNKHDLDGNQVTTDGWYWKGDVSFSWKYTADPDHQHNMRVTVPTSLDERFGKYYLVSLP